MAAERAWKLTRSAFEFFTPEGRFNDRQQAQAVVAAALRHLSSPAWAKTRRLLLRRESFTFLDQAQRRLAELGLDPDVLSALLDLEGCSAKPGDCRSQRPGQPRHGLGRWPARSNLAKAKPTGRNELGGFVRYCVECGVPAAWWNASTAWRECIKGDTAR